MWSLVNHLHSHFCAFAVNGELSVTLSSHSASMPIKKPPARLGAEWRGRGATQAKLGAAAVAMPRSWCGVNEPWSPTASDLQEFLQRNKTEADAFIAPPAARSSCADPSSGEAEQVDEGELIALLHAVSPTFACARASNSLDLECTTAPSFSTPYEQTMSSAAASPSPTMELPTRPRCANVRKQTSRQRHQIKTMRKTN